MLRLELAGVPYNKSRENEALRSKLNGRSKAAVEFKHQNISAVLMSLGWVPIAGYKPAQNYQKSLVEEVATQLLSDDDLDRLSQRALKANDDTEFALPALAPDVVSTPSLVLEVGDWLPRELGVKRDYLFLDAQNAKLGLAGELAAVAFERQRLAALGREDLAQRVEHVAQTRGDGLGYDVLSFESNGRKRYVEVKTTRHARETPFFVSAAELSASAYFGEEYIVHRYFRFPQKPGLYFLQGSLSANCSLQPTAYRAVPSAI